MRMRGRGLLWSLVRTLMLVHVQPSEFRNALDESFNIVEVVPPSELEASHRHATLFETGEERVIPV